MTDSLQVRGVPAAAVGAVPDSTQTPSAALPVHRPGRTEAFDACVEEIRRRYLAAENLDVMYVLTNRLHRRLGLAPRGVRAMALAGLVGVGVRLFVVLIVTALAGQWMGLPWGRWAVLLALLGLNDATMPFMAPPPDLPLGPRLRRIVDDWMALLPAISREADLRDLAGFTRRWIRLPVAVAAGVAVMALMLGASWIVTPTGMSELPAGSIFLLALVLYEFGNNTVYWGNVINWALLAREARYDHDLFWASPADAPEVRKVYRKTSTQGSAAALWISIYLVLAVLIVSWSSPAVVPLAAGFAVIGYLTTVGFAVANRASVRRIVERIRQERLQGLQRRIDEFGPRYTHLSPQESEELRELLLLHDRIADAPVAPSTTHVVIRNVAGLLIPTVMFVITVFGEVSAERFLDAILP